jgi:predicted lipid-binding transport protein (Tim44 family)
MAASGKGDFVERLRGLYRNNAPDAAEAIVDAAAHGDLADLTLAVNASTMRDVH